jgi:hypothetical protein
VRQSIDCGLLPLIAARTRHCETTPFGISPISKGVEVSLASLLGLRSVLRIEGLSNPSVFAVLQEVSTTATFRLSRARYQWLAMVGK